MALAFIIFGWPRRDKDYGPAYPLHCPRCENDVLFHVVKSRRWLSIFFIPLLPLSRATYYIVCPICGAESAVERTEASALQTLVEPAGQLQAGEISDDEFSATVSAVEADIRDGEAIAMPAAHEDVPTPAVGAGIEHHLAEYEPGDIVLDTEVATAAGLEAEDVQDRLAETDSVEAADDTGRRWRVVE